MKNENLPKSTLALLGALEFLWRMGSDNPPNENDRQMKLDAVQKALLEIDPAFKERPYFGQFFRN